MFIIKYDSNQELDISQIFDQTKGDPEHFTAAFNKPTYKKALTSWLPFLDKRGYLDVLLPNAPVTSFVQAIMDQIPKSETAQLSKAEE